MMLGYDKDEAVRFILERIHTKDHPELADRLPELIPQIIDADMAFMHETGVLDEDGAAGDEYYEDDEAIEYIVETITAICLTSTFHLVFKKDQISGKFNSICILESLLLITCHRSLQSLLNLLRLFYLIGRWKFNQR